MKRILPALALLLLGVAAACAGLTRGVDTVTAPSNPADPNSPSKAEVIAHTYTAGTPWDALVPILLGSGGLLAGLFGTVKAKEAAKAATTAQTQVDEGFEDHAANAQRIAALEAKLAAGTKPA